MFPWGRLPQNTAATCFSWRVMAPRRSICSTITVWLPGRCRSAPAALPIWRQPSRRADRLQSSSWVADRTWASQWNLDSEVAAWGEVWDRSGLLAPSAEASVDCSAPRTVGCVGGKEEPRARFSTSEPMGLELEGKKDGSIVVHKVHAGSAERAALHKLAVEPLSTSYVVN